MKKIRNVPINTHENINCKTYAYVNIDQINSVILKKVFCVL